MHGETVKLKKKSGTYSYSCVKSYSCKLSSCQVPSTNFVKQFMHKYSFIFRRNTFKKNFVKRLADSS